MVVTILFSHNSTFFKAPTDFIRGIWARKLDSFQLDFVSMSDERGSIHDK